MSTVNNIYYNEVPEFTHISKEMVLVKTCVYAKRYMDESGNIFYNYLSLFGFIPRKDYFDEISHQEGKHLPTNGIYITVLGPGCIVRPNRKFILRQYQDYLEKEDYKFVDTVTNCKGMSYEEARKKAFQIIRHHRKCHNKLDGIPNNDIINSFICFMEELNIPVDTVNLNRLCNFLNYKGYCQSVNCGLKCELFNKIEEKNKNKEEGTPF